MHIRFLLMFYFTTLQQNVLFNSKMDSEVDLADEDLYVNINCICITAAQNSLMNFMGKCIN